MFKTLYLIRHGQTDWNLQRKLQGHSNIPLNDLGRSQAQGLADFFQKNPVEKVFSSDLDRALQTAQIATNNESIIKMPGLREVCFGDIEGHTLDQVKEQFGEKVWQIWSSPQPPEDFSFPGGESHRDSLKRFIESLEHIFTAHEFKKAAVCTHGLMIRRLGHYLLPHLEDILPIPNCGVFELHWKENKIFFQGLVFQPTEPS